MLTSTTNYNISTYNNFLSRHNNFKRGKGMISIEQEKLNEVGHLLLEIKCLARLGALASESCIDDNELQLQDNLEYYFILRKITNLVVEIEKLIQD